MMYPNLSAEMVRKGLTASDVAKVINVSYDTATNKISGRTDFKLAEAKTIIRELFPESNIFSLFATNNDARDSA